MNRVTGLYFPTKVVIFAIKLQVNSDAAYPILISYDKERSVNLVRADLVDGSPVIVGGKIGRASCRERV